MSDLVRRLDNMAEVLIESPKFSSFCHLVYDTSGEIERLTAELAAAKTNAVAREARVEALSLAGNEALELAQDLYSYCIDQWRWKYGEYWDAELAAIRAALTKE